MLNRRASYLMAASGLISTMGSTAQAQVTGSTATADSGGLQEIVVVAQKRSENAQDVPISIASISNQRLEAAGVFNTTQLNTVSPSLNVNTVAGNLEPHLRGIGNSANGPGNENTVALYVDDVYYASQLFGPASLDDAEQITVLKGPQGTLFGRNATAGVITVKTRGPSHDFGGDVTASLDSYLTTRGKLFITGPIAEDIATSLSASFTTQDKGWGRNVNNGDKVGIIDHDFNIRSKWLFTPSDRTSIRINFDYSDRADSAGFNLIPYSGSTLVVPGYRFTGNPWDVDDFVTTKIKFKGGGASGALEQDLGFGKFTSITAYRKFKYWVDFDPLAFPVPGQRIILPSVGSQFTEEVQLVSEESSAIKWAVGGYYFWGDGGTGSEPFQILLSGILAPTPTSLRRIDIHTEGTTRSLAGFAQVTGEVFADTNLTVGFRYTYEKRTFSGGQTGTLVDGTSLGALPTPVLPPSVSFRRPTWRISLDHKFSPDVMAYVSYNRGFKSGGFNGLDPSNPPYNPETLDAYEAGLKLELLNRRLRLNGAIFHYDYRDIQVSRYTTTAITYNGAGAKVSGVDLDFEAALGNFRLGGGIEWLAKAKFTEFPQAQFVAPNPGGGLTLFSGDAKGNRLPWSAKFQGVITLDYDKDLDFGKLHFNLTNNYNSGYYTDPANFVRQPSYYTLNMSADWTAPSGRFNLKLWATNLFEEVVYSQTANQNTGAVVAIGNAPRTFGITGKFSF